MNKNLYNSLSILSGEVKLVCAWCNKVLKEGPEDNISHGICQECRDKMYEEMGVVPPEKREDQQ